MNIVDIVILGVMGLCLVAGMYKGFLSSGLSLCAFVGSWFASLKLYPKVVAFVSGNTAIMDSLRSILDSEEMFQTGSMYAMKVAQATNEQLGQAASEIHIPLINDMFRDNLMGRVFESVDLSTVGDYLTETLLMSFLNILAFVLVFIAAYVVGTLLVNLFAAVFRFPQLRHLDGLLGGLIGLVRGFVILSLVFAVLPALASTLQSLGVKGIQEMVDSSRFSHYFLNLDLLSTFVRNIMK